VPGAQTNTTPLIRSLLDPRVWGHETQDLFLVETHISWVILTGPFAYKIKKPVNLGFLDFSTLEKRHFYCREELRLNRRLAPKLYVDVIAINGEATRPVINGSGPALEYAVKMVQFPQEAQLDRVLARGALGARHIDKLAQRVAVFHENIAVAAPESPYGEPEQIQELVLANFDRVLSELRNQDTVNRLQALRHWAQQEYQRCHNVLAARKRQGFVRECHGDMHLRNIALLDDELVIFDGIEFSDSLRWIDVISEVAFLVMDLNDRQQPQLARRFLNAYLEHTGDYAGVEVMRYYLLYRAMVRAMVDAIRVRQPGMSETERYRVLDEYGSYVSLAERYTHIPHPALIITRGLSGSGKTTVAQTLLEHYPAIRIRSDVERKRLHGLDAAEHTGSDVDRGLYTPEATSRTYERLAELARTIVKAGHSVIVDAAFLRREQRTMFREVAHELNVPFLILDCQAPVETLKGRTRSREREARDASEATLVVLERQLAAQEPLTESEKTYSLSIDTTEAPKGARIADTLRERLRI
jgi:aminoglycoside phosphotransferase family enzyme/predicted kinase